MFLGIVQVAQVPYPLPCEEGTIYLHQIWGDVFNTLLTVLRSLISTFSILVSDQLNIVWLYVTTGSAKELIALILLHAINLLFRIDLTPQKHSFQFFSLIQQYCIPSPSVTPRYL